MQIDVNAMSLKLLLTEGANQIFIANALIFIKSSFATKLKILQRRLFLFLEIGGRF